MFTVNQSGSVSLHGGISRRSVLRVGALALGGLTLDQVLGLRAASASAGGRQKSVIMIHLSGGPSHLDMYDMKPDAPVEYRGDRWPSLLAITAAYAFMYHTITLAEEAYLRHKFGAAFTEYCRDVPRWWPRLRGLAATFTKTRFNWARVLAKEYSAPLGWTLPIVLIGLYNIHAATGFAQRPVTVALLWGVLGLAFSFWLVVGLLKKTRSAALGGAR